MNKKEAEKQSESNRTISLYNSLWKEQDDIYSSAAKRYGLSDSTMWILYFLRLNGGCCSQKDIASSMLQPKQTTNSAVKQLERDGYVTLRCGADRRCRLVELTPAGKQLAERTSDHVISAERGVWEEFTSEEQEQFIALLTKYNKRLKARMEDNYNNEE